MNNIHEQNVLNNDKNSVYGSYNAFTCCLIQYNKAEGLNLIQNK